MSVAVLRTLFCDGHCASWIYQSPDRASELRRAAKLEGWEYCNGKDLCPDCAFKRKAMKEPGRALPPMRLDELEQECRDSWTAEHDSSEPR